MRTLPLVLAAVLAVPAAARSEEPQSPEPQWNIGAGVSTGYYVLVGPAQMALATAGLGAYYALTSTPATTVAASIERSLSPRTWLVFGVTGSYEHDTFDTVPTPGSSALHRLNVSTASASVGVRQVVTPRRAPVDVSWVLTADAAWARSDATIAFPGAPDGTQRYTDTIAGATLGIAVDRELGAGISVRVATPLVRGAWTRQTLHADFATANPDTKGTQVGVGVLLQPRLELRLAF